MTKLFTLTILALIVTLQVNAQWQNNSDGINYNGGKVGIGTSVPNAPLSIHQAAITTPLYPTTTQMGDIYSTYIGDNNVLEIGVSKGHNSRKAWILTRHRSTEAYGKYYGVLHLQPDIGSKSKYKGVSIGFPANSELPYGTHLAIAGKMGIGTRNPLEMLHVNGIILASEVKVSTEANQVPDYVFKEDYQLTSLADLEEYIKTNSHLPEVPSAEEIEANGLELAKMNLLLLKKIEELTLYVINQQKEIEYLKVNSLMKN